MITIGRDKQQTTATHTLRWLSHLLYDYYFFPRLSFFSSVVNLGRGNACRNGVTKTTKQYQSGWFCPGLSLPGGTARHQIRPGCRIKPFLFLDWPRGWSLMQPVRTRLVNNACLSATALKCAFSPPHFGDQTPNKHVCLIFFFFFFVIDGRGCYLKPRPWLFFFFFCSRPTNIVNFAQTPISLFAFRQTIKHGLAFSPHYTFTLSSRLAPSSSPYATTNTRHPSATRATWFYIYNATSCTLFFFHMPLVGSACTPPYKTTHFSFSQNSHTK
jgi:hypothetical protein